MKKILIFPCGSEIAREVLESLKDNKDYYLYGGSSVEDKGKYLPYGAFIDNIPYYYEENFIRQFSKILDEYGIDYVFPCHDDISLKLSQNKYGFNKTKIITHSSIINEICRFKDKTYDLFKDEEFCPRFEYKKFPRFLKPKNSNGSKGAKLINNKEELDSYYKKYNKNNTLSLEYLPGEEYTIDCFSQNGILKFIGSRKRDTSKMGIAEISTGYIDNEIRNIAIQIHNKFQNIPYFNNNGFNGAWFFQLKKDKDNNYKILEIGSRISGGMSFYRMEGINFSELSILVEDNIDCKIRENSYIIVNSFAKFFIPKFKYNIGFYNKVYIDFDDTLYFHKTKTLNTNLIKFLFQEMEKKNKLYLITRSKIDFYEILKKYKIENIFDGIIHIRDNSPKYDFIKENSIFIDDSFKERNFYKQGVWCFGLDNFKILIND
jgi:hypothetical protein